MKKSNLILLLILILVSVSVTAQKTVAPEPEKPIDFKLYQNLSCDFCNEKAIKSDAVVYGRCVEEMKGRDEDCQKNTINLFHILFFVFIFLLVIFAAIIFTKRKPKDKEKEKKEKEEEEAKERTTDYGLMSWILLFVLLIAGWLAIHFLFRNSMFGFIMWSALIIFLGGLVYVKVISKKPFENRISKLKRKELNDIVILAISEEYPGNWEIMTESFSNKVNIGDGRHVFYTMIRNKSESNHKRVVLLTDVNPVDYGDEPILAEQTMRQIMKVVYRLIKERTGKIVSVPEPTVEYKYPEEILDKKINKEGGESAI